MSIHNSRFFVSFSLPDDHPAVVELDAAREFYDAVTEARGDELPAATEALRRLTAAHVALDLAFSEAYTSAVRHAEACEAALAEYPRTPRLARG